MCFLSGVNSLSFLDEMSQIKKIKFFNLKHGELSFLLNIPHLKEVGFYLYNEIYRYGKNEVKGIIKNDLIL